MKDGAFCLYMLGTEPQ